MKVIIHANRIAALATDAYQPTGDEQVVLAAPDGLDPEKLGAYVYRDGVLAGPGLAADKGPADYPLQPWQFKAMVNYLDKDTEIRTAIGQIEDALDRSIALSRYLNSTFYDYNDPLVQQVRQAIGMSEADLSEAWMQIATR